MIRRFEIFKVRPGTPPEILERFEAMFRVVDRYIPVVHETFLGRNIAPTEVTHIWEHSFCNFEEYNGVYMNHPYHACVLDRYLLPGNPERITERSRGGGMFLYEPDDWPAERNHGLKRLVILQMRADASPEDVAALEDEMRRLPERVPGMRLSIVGRNQVGGPAWRGPAWTHVWEQAFADEAALAAYRALDGRIGELERLGWPARPDSPVERVSFTEYWKD